MKTIEQRVRDCLARVLGVISQEIKGAESLVADLGADELDLVEIAMTIEDEFEINVPDEEMDYVTTVDQLVTLVAGKYPQVQQDKRA